MPTGYACGHKTWRAIGTRTKAERQELSGADDVNSTLYFNRREFLTAAGRLESHTIRAPSKRLVRFACEAMKSIDELITANNY